MTQRVDGGEGGTGAAPLEFSNSVGTPYREGLAFAYDALVGFDIKQYIKIISYSNYNYITWNGNFNSLKSTKQVICAKAAASSVLWA